MTILQTTECNSFLRGLPQPEMAALRLHLVPLRLRAGDLLHDFAAPVQRVVFPHSGVVALGIPGPGGTGPGILVGREGLIGGFTAASGCPATCAAEVRIGGEAHCIPAGAFRDLVEDCPRIWRQLAIHEIATLVQVQQAALCHASHSVEARVCRCLLEIRDRIGSDRVPLTQSVLAQMLGVRRTTITLVAGQLEKTGALQCFRGFMVIRSAELLKRYCCDCPAQLHDYQHAAFLAERRAAGTERSP